MKGCKSFLGLLLLLPFSSNAQINAMSRGGWFAEIQPFYVQARTNIFSNLTFARADALTCDGNRFHLDDDDWQWGYKIALGYDFRNCNCNDYGFSLEFTSFKIDDDDRANSSNALLFSPFAGFQFGNFSTANAELDSHYYTLDLLGHKNFVNCRSIIRLFAGLRFLKLDEELSTDFSFDSPSVLIPFDRTLNVKLEHDYESIGPRIGIHASYSFVNCLAINGQLAGGFQVGNREREQRIRFVQSLSATDEIITTSDFNHHHRERTAVVPNIGAELGVAYHTVFCNCSSFAVELGYRFDDYFNIIDPNFAGRSCGCDCVDSHDKRNEDFIFHGPYLKLTYHI